MIALSPEAKQAYAKYVGPDGKLIIDDTVPENLKETFQFFNDNNINILELNIERIYNDTFDEDQEIDEEDIDEIIEDISSELIDDEEDNDNSLDDLFSDL